MHFVQKIMLVPHFSSFSSFFREFSDSYWGRMDFLHEVQFSAGIGPAHFPAEMTRPLGRGHLPFLPTCFNVFVWSSMVTCLFLGFSPFSASRNEVFFSLKGVARRAVRFVLVSDRWESWLSQVADSRTKQPMRQHFSVAIEAAHFPDPKIDALQQSREGAPIHGDGLSRI